MLRLTSRSQCATASVRTGLCRAGLNQASMSTASRPIRNRVVAAKATPGQEARGHAGEGGADGWKIAGWDLTEQSLSPKLREMLVTYGEMSQATYDNLGLDQCDKNTYGQTLSSNPQDLLKYLTSNYPLDEKAPAPNATGTGERYKLPNLCTVKHNGSDITLSPLIHALPGQLTDGKIARRYTNWSALNGFVDKLFNTGSTIMVAFIDGNNGGRALFRTNPVTGRGKQARGSFIGYVATTTPKNPDDEVDVALVWRGTIFREEWQSNFAQDELRAWRPDPTKAAEEIASRSAKPVSGSTPSHKNHPFHDLESFVDEDHTAPDPGLIGVHDGFDDLYNRAIDQPESGEHLSPRQVVRKWLMKLMKEHKVTTITTTGHSLGGGLATISAFGCAKLLDDEFDTWNKAGWKTQEKPKVTLISFASPRGGNFKFVEEFRRLNVRALRIVNKGDIVPLVPGLFVQFFTSVFEKLPIPVIGKIAALDMDSWPVRTVGWLYYAVSWVWAKVPVIGWNTRWGYFHVGQVLELDPAEGGQGVIVGDLGAGPRHNLEVNSEIITFATSMSYCVNSCFVVIRGAS
eukprot:GHUV01005887.1.p1 GENE.GHUV01005887.1~~GHUV01005887.1.p1  ORF type:complete len:573 (+),score=69.78 GHUV01005887.1:124-1842(+)